jgi:hypothetical protein
MLDGSMDPVDLPDDQFNQLLAYLTSLK